MTSVQSEPNHPGMPVVARTREELRAARRALADGDVAVVMTMGALHEGHATLIRTARKTHAHVIVTIFLNPLQFGPKEDLSRYPRTFDADMEICTATLVSASRPARWATSWKGKPGLDTSTACSPSSANSCT